MTTIRSTWAVKSHLGFSRKDSVQAKTFVFLFVAFLVAVSMSVSEMVQGIVDFLGSFKNV